jgi:hypothetical protein
VGKWGGEALYASIAHDDHLKELRIEYVWIKFAVLQLLWNMDKRPRSSLLLFLNFLLYSPH